MPQLTVDAARVNRDTEALCNSIGQLGGGDPRLGELNSCHKLHLFLPQLVSGSRSPFVWQQTGETRLLKSCLCLIERGSREAKRFGGLADRLLVDLYLAQHLVLDLQQVFRIEELAVSKTFVLHVLWSRIQNALLPEECAFGLARICHNRL